MADSISIKSIIDNFDYKLFIGKNIKDPGKDVKELPPLHSKLNSFIELGKDNLLYSIVLSGLKFTRKLYEPGLIEAEVTIKPEKKDAPSFQWVSFRGNNSTMTTSSEYMNIQSSNKCYVYGNVMSLLSKEDFATMTTLPYEHTFQNLFMDNIHITSYESDNSSLDENKILVLPATTLKSYCYYQMFSGCLNLNYIKCLATKIPEDEEFCTYNWLYNAGRTILDNDGKCTFVKSADATFNWPRSDSGIPVGWDVKTE